MVRTFALHEAHGHADYDLCDSTHCQLLHWGGNPARQPPPTPPRWPRPARRSGFTGSALSPTSIKTAAGEQLRLTRFGRSARALSLSAFAARPLLHGRRRQEWASELTRAELTAALAAAGVAAPGWQHLTVERQRRVGPRRHVAPRRDAKSPPKTFRLAVGQALGWNRIPSTWFEVSRQGDRFLFHGRGWGHGVGLCQKGAAAMAAQGRTAQQILQQYFPGAQAADEATGRAWQSFAAQLDSFSNRSMPPMPPFCPISIAHAPKHRSAPA